MSDLHVAIWLERQNQRVKGVVIKSVVDHFPAERLAHFDPPSAGDVFIWDANWHGLMFGAYLDLMDEGHMISLQLAADTPLLVMLVNRMRLDGFDLTEAHEDFWELWEDKPTRITADDVLCIQ